MKNIALLIGITLALFAFFGCSKSNSGSGNNGPATWTLNGTTYNGNAATYDTSSGLCIMTSADLKGDYISVIFFSHPTISGNYTVTNGSLPSAGAYCYIQTGIYASGTSTLYTSTGQTGDNVSLTISGTKVKANFSSVAAAHNSTAATISGSIVH